MRFILVSAILLPLFLVSSECNGYVRNLEVFENYLFTGVCDDSGNRYVGITNFTERPGESFSGFRESFLDDKSTPILGPTSFCLFSRTADMQ